MGTDEAPQLPEQLRGGVPRPLPAWAPAAGEVSAFIGVAVVIAIGTALAFLRYRAWQQAWILPIPAGVLAPTAFWLGWRLQRERRLLATGDLAAARVTRVDTGTRAKTRLCVTYELDGDAEPRREHMHEFRDNEIGLVGIPDPGDAAWIIRDPRQPDRQLPWGFTLSPDHEDVRRIYVQGMKHDWGPTVVQVVAFLAMWIGGTLYIFLRHLQRFGD